jgi:hypothetical protein
LPSRCRGAGRGHGGRRGRERIPSPAPPGPAAPPGTGTPLMIVPSCLLLRLGCLVHSSKLTENYMRKPEIWDFENPDLSSRRMDFFGDVFCCAKKEASSMQTLAPDMTPVNRRYSISTPLEPLPSLLQRTRPVGQASRACTSSRSSSTLCRAGAAASSTIRMSQLTAILVFCKGGARRLGRHTDEQQQQQQQETDWGGWDRVWDRGR